MSNLDDLAPDSIVSTAILAELLEISPRRVEQLTALGVIPKEGRGRYRVDRAVPGYCEWLAVPSYRRLVLQQSRGVDVDDFDD